MTAASPQPRVLVIEYTQTGATADLAEAFAAPLVSRGISVDRERIQARAEYPFPWKRIGRFFDVMPDCILGHAPEIETPDFDPQTEYDLIAIFYQVWFLAPSLPIQGFLKHPAAAVLRGRRVMTVVVSRNMWTVASEKLKRQLGELGARHRDNVSVTHQGPIWATFVTIPRLLLFGKRDRLWSIFPPPGLDSTQLDRLTTYGRIAADKLTDSQTESDGPWLAGQHATHVEQRYVLPEIFGERVFRFWATVLIGLEKRVGRWARQLGIYCFVFSLVCLILLGIPILLIARVILFPIVQPWLKRRVALLQEPSDCAWKQDEHHSRTDQGQLLAGSPPSSL